MGKQITPERISHLIGLIYDCVIKPDLWQSTIDTVRLEIGSANCAVAASSFQTGDLLLSILSGLEAKWANSLADYGEENIKSWGGIERMMQYPLDEPLIQSQTAGLDTYQNNRFFREWVQPQGLVDCIAIGIARDERVVGHMAWGRHEREGPIEEHELATLRLLAPHFRRAVTISGLMDMQSLATASLARALDALTVAVYLVDGDLSIVHANAIAEQRLKEGQPVSSREGKLKFQSPRIQATLVDAVARAAAGDAAMGQRGIGVPLLERDGSPAIAHVLPLGRSELRSGLQQRAKAAVFIASSATAPSMPAAALAHIYDLTPAETRIFEMIAAGRTQGDISQHLGIAPSTVKSHLLKVFDKTGTSRQADFVRLAASLSF